MRTFRMPSTAPARLAPRLRSPGHLPRLRHSGGGTALVPCATVPAADRKGVSLVARLLWRSRSRPCAPRRRSAWWAHALCAATYRLPGPAPRWCGTPRARSRRVELVRRQQHQLGAELQRQPDHVERVVTGSQRVPFGRAREDGYAVHAQQICHVAGAYPSGCIDRLTGRYALTSSGPGTAGSRRSPYQ
jgi:hypothetical protein